MKVIGTIAFEVLSTFMNPWENYERGPNRDYEKAEDKIFGHKKKWRLKISLNFPHVKTKDWTPAENLKIKF